MIAFTATFGSAQATLAAATAVQDPTIRTSTTFAYMPPISNIVGVYPIGVTISGAQLQAPSLKKFINYDIAPLDVSATPTTPYKYLPHYLSPYVLQPNEGLQAYLTDTAGTIDYVIVELSDGPVAPVSPAGALTIKATATITAVAANWTNGTLTFTQTLPVGNYQLIGFRVEAAGVVAARLFPVGGIYRPGVIARQGVSDMDAPYDRFGGKGVLFTFNQLTPPSLDILGTVGSKTCTVYLDIIATT